MAVGGRGRRVGNLKVLPDGEVGTVGVQDGPARSAHDVQPHHHLRVIRGGQGGRHPHLRGTAVLRQAVLGQLTAVGGGEGQDDPLVHNSYNHLGLNCIPVHRGRPLQFRRLRDFVRVVLPGGEQERHGGADRRGGDVDGERVAGLVGPVIPVGGGGPQRGLVHGGVAVLGGHRHGGGRATGGGGNPGEGGGYGNGLAVIVFHHRPPVHRQRQTGVGVVNRQVGSSRRPQRRGHAAHLHRFRAFRYLVVVDGQPGQRPRRGTGGDGHGGNGHRVRGSVRIIRRAGGSVRHRQGNNRGRGNVRRRHPGRVGGGNAHPGAVPAFRHRIPGGHRQFHHRVVVGDGQADALHRVGAGPSAHRYRFRLFGDDVVGNGQGGQGLRIAHVAGGDGDGNGGGVVKVGRLGAGADGERQGNGYGLGDVGVRRPLVGGGYGGVAGVAVRLRGRPAHRQRDHRIVVGDAQPHHRQHVVGFVVHRHRPPGHPKGFGVQSLGPGVVVDRYIHVGVSGGGTGRHHHPQQVVGRSPGRQSGIDDPQVLPDRKGGPVPVQSRRIPDKVQTDHRLRGGGLRDYGRYPHRGGSGVLRQAGHRIAGNGVGHRDDDPVDDVKSGGVGNGGSVHDGGPGHLDFLGAFRVVGVPVGGQIKGSGGADVPGGDFNGKSVVGLIGPKIIPRSGRRSRPQHRPVHPVAAGYHHRHRKRRGAGGGGNPGVGGRYRNDMGAVPFPHLGFVNRDFYSGVGVGRPQGQLVDRVRPQRGGPRHQQSFRLFRHVVVLDAQTGQSPGGGGGSGAVGDAHRIRPRRVGVIGGGSSGSVFGFQGDDGGGPDVGGGGPGVESGRNQHGGAVPALGDRSGGSSGVGKGHHRFVIGYGEGIAADRIGGGGSVHGDGFRPLRDGVVGDGQHGQNPRGGDGTGGDGYRNGRPRVGEVGVFGIRAGGEVQSHHRRGGYVGGGSPGEGGGYGGAAGVPHRLRRRPGDAQLDHRVVVVDVQGDGRHRQRFAVHRNVRPAHRDGFSGHPLRRRIIVYHQGDVGVSASAPGGDDDPQRMTLRGPGRQGRINHPQVLPGREGGGVGVQNGGDAGHVHPHHHFRGGVAGQGGRYPHRLAPGVFPEAGHRRPRNRVGEGEDDAVYDVKSRRVGNGGSVHGSGPGHLDFLGSFGVVAVQAGGYLERPHGAGPPRRNVDDENVAGHPRPAGGEIPGGGGPQSGPIRPVAAGDGYRHRGEGGAGGGVRPRKRGGDGNRLRAGPLRDFRRGNGQLDADVGVVHRQRRPDGGRPQGGDTADGDRFRPFGYRVVRHGQAGQRPGGGTLQSPGGYDHPVGGVGGGVGVVGRADGGSVRRRQGDHHVGPYVGGCGSGLESGRHRHPGAAAPFGDGGVGGDAQHHHRFVVDDGKRSLVHRVSRGFPAHGDGLGELGDVVVGKTQGGEGRFG